MALSDREVTRAGFKLSIASGSVSRKVQQAILKGLRGSSDIYFEAVLQNVSLTGVSLQDMRDMGHPYSTDHAPNTLGDDRQVHIQSGEFKDSLKKGSPEQGSERIFTVYFSSSSGIANYLIFGTSKMRPRRFHEKAYNDIRSKVWEPLVENLKKVEHKITVTPPR